jgi:hypothetical protein
MDSYWRTRTHCRSRPSDQRDTFVGNVPLRCQRCGNREPIIGVKHHGNNQAYGKPSEMDRQVISRSGKGKSGA